MAACENTEYIDPVDGELYCKSSCGDKAINKASTPSKCDSDCYYYVKDEKKICTQSENTCPPDYPFTLESSGKQTQCVSTCPEYLTTDDKCVSDCPYYFVNASNNELMCLQSNESCHAESSDSELRENDKVTGLRCESSCDEMDKKRVQLQDGTCSEACPEGQLN